MYFQNGIEGGLVLDLYYVHKFLLSHEYSVAKSSQQPAIKINLSLIWCCNLIFFRKQIPV